MVTRTCRCVVTLVVLGLLGSGAVVRAQSLVLDEKAALVARIELNAIEPLSTTVLRPFGLTFPLLVERALVTVLGFNPLSSSGWQSFGVTGTDLWLELSASSTRLLFRGDPARVKQALARTPVLVPAKNTPALRARGVFFAAENKLGLRRYVTGRALPDGLVAVEINDQLRVSAGKPPLRWTQSQLDFMQGGGVSVWISSAHADEFLTHRFASNANRIPLCSSLGEYFGNGPIEMLLLRLAPVDRGLALRFRLVGRNTQLRTAFALAQPTPPRAIPSTHVAALHLELSPMTLAGLDRPRALRTLENVRTVTGQCGARAHLGLPLFGWPGLLGMFFDELARSHDNAERILHGAGAVTLVVKTAAPQPEAFIGLFALDLSEDARALTGDLVEIVFGKPVRGREYGEGPLRAAFDERTLLLALGKNAFEWWREPDSTVRPAPGALLDLWWHEPQTLSWLTQRARAPFATRLLESFPHGALRMELTGDDIEGMLRLSRQR